MNMCRHYNVAFYSELFRLPQAFKFLKEEILAGRLVEKLLPLITTARDEMKVIASVKSLESFSHGSKSVTRSRPPFAPRARCSEWGTRHVMKRRSLRP